MARKPIHPGETLGENLDALNMTPTELARQIDVVPNRISQIVKGKRSVTGDTALRLGRFFNMSAEFWINLQTIYDLRIAEQESGVAIAKLPVLDMQTWQKENRTGQMDLST